MYGKTLACRCAVLGLSVLLGSSSTSAQQLGAEEAGDKSLLAADRSPDEAGDAPDLCRCIGESNSPSVARIEAALRSPLTSTGFDFVDTPLEETLGFLQEEYGIRVQLDTRALDEVGLGPDEPVTINLHNVSLQSALRLMLQRLNLTYIIQNEVLIVTTPEAAEADLTTCVYDVRDLIGDTSDPSGKALVDAITSCVATETWAVNGGGEAEVRTLQPALLVISQMRSVHEEIRGLLASMRALRRAPPAAAESASAPRPAEADALVTRWYALRVAQVRDFEKIREQVRDMIVQSLPDEQWKGRLADGQPVILAVLPDRIVLRHRESVHDAVEKLLTESGVAAVLPDAHGEIAGRGFPSGGMGGGGGFFQPAHADAE